MKRAAMVVVMITLATVVFALQQTPATQSRPATQPGAAQQGTPQPGAGAPAQGAAQPTTPQAKRPPQAKTQPEFDAYKAAITSANDPPAMEKAADDFAAKFPDSELRVLLYRTAMHSYQSANNADKMMDMGRKVLKTDPDDPEALLGVAQVLAERTRDTDLDKEQRQEECEKLAKHALETVDTDITVPANTPQEKIDAYKAFLRSNAYYVLGTLEFSKDKFADAENYLRKSIDAYPSQPDPVGVLRLALSLDKQEKYPEALKFANQAVQLTQDNSQLGGLARNERDRLQQLTNATPAPAPKPPSNSPPNN